MQSSQWPYFGRPHRPYWETTQAVFERSGRILGDNAGHIYNSGEDAGQIFRETTQAIFLGDDTAHSSYLGEQDAFR